MNESFTQGELFELSLEYEIYIRNIVDLYIVFILDLKLCYILVINDKFKKDNPLLYNALILIGTALLFIFAIMMCYKLNQFIVKILNKVVEWITNFILKMMGFRLRPSPPHQPGGFGEPSGGGGKPPKKPGGPQPPKGHYTSSFEEEDERQDEEDEIEEMEKLQKAKKNEKAKIRYDRMDPVKKEIKLANKRKTYNNLEEEEQKQQGKRN